MQDLPSGLLSQLLGTVPEHESWRSLFSTCKLLRDATLAHTDNIQCQLDVSTVTHAQAARSLQLLATCKEGAEVKLVLQDPRTEPGRGEEQYIAQFTSWLNTLCSEHGILLEPITHVELKAHVYGGLVPDGIQACCPKMTHFSRWGWIKNTPKIATTDGHVCSQLHHLTVLNLGPSDWDNNYNMSAEQLRQQFSLLPNLQSLHCLLQPTSHRNYKVEGARRYQQAAAYLKDSIQPLRSHLESLVLPNGLDYTSVIPALCIDAWPQLTRLVMPDAVLHDRGVDLLLSQAPQVTELQVSDIVITRDFGGRECGWRNLTVDTIYCYALTWLPIGKVSTLRLQAIGMHAEDWSCMQSVTAILSGMDKVEAVKQSLGVYVGFGCGITEPQVPIRVAVLQLIQHDQIVLDYSGCQLPLWLQVLEQVDCHHLTMYINSIPEDCWVTILQQQPRLQVLHLKQVVWKHSDPVAWLDGLATFCGHAQRAFALHIDSKLAEALPQGWHETLVSSMHASGHQHVTILTAL